MAFTYAGQYTEVILGTSAAGFAVALPALTVNVYTVSTTTAVTLYTSRTKGSTASNPATTDVNGNLTFYTNPGPVDIVFTPPGGSQKRITVMVPQDPAEDSATYTAIVESPPTPERFGATGNGSTDDTTALTNWLAGGYSHVALSPNKVYLTTATQTQPVGTVFDGNGSTIKASGTIAGPILDTPSGTVSRDGVTRNVTLACNNNAQTGWYPRYVAHHTADGITVWDATSHSVILGDPGAPSTSYECIVHNLNVDRPSRTSTPASSNGLWARNAADNEIVQAVLVGNDVGIRLDTGDNKITGAHAWGYSTSLPTTCFSDNSTQNKWIACTADSPTTYGWYLDSSAQRGSIIGCNAFNGVLGGNGVATGVWFNNGNEYDIAGLSIEGQSGHFWGWDAQGTLTRLAASGVHKVFVNTENIPGMGLSRMGNAWDPRQLISTSDETLPRDICDHTNVLPTSGTLLLSYLVSRKTAQTVSFRIPTGGTASSGLTYAAVGLYKEDATTKNLTLVASIASDTTLFNATFSATAGARSWTTPYQRNVGDVFALGVLCVGTTMPGLCGTFPIISSENLLEPKICAALSGQASLPASITNASLQAASNRMYGVLV